MIRLRAVVVDDDDHHKRLEVQREGSGGQLAELWVERHSFGYASSGPRVTISFPSSSDKSIERARAVSIALHALAQLAEIIEARGFDSFGADDVAGPDASWRWSGWHDADIMAAVDAERQRLEEG